MKIINRTSYKVEDIISSAVMDEITDGLRIEIKYSPLGSRRFISGTYYRRTPKYPDGKLIRIRINRENNYPIKIPFKTSQYRKSKDLLGREVVHQVLDMVALSCPEHLIVAIFLHEFSHYIDHIEGRNGKYKQTKADKYAVTKLRAMGIAMEG